MLLNATSPSSTYRYIIDIYTYNVDSYFLQGEQIAWHLVLLLAAATVLKSFALSKSAFVRWVVVANATLPYVILYGWMGGETVNKHTNILLVQSPALRGGS